MPQDAAVRSLLKDATSEDGNLRVSALGALAASGDPAAADMLLQAARKEAWQKRAQVTAYVLEFADRLARRGHANRAEEILRRLMRAHEAPDEIHARCAALAGLANLLAAGAVQDVVAALTDENPELRAAAMEIAVKLSGEDVTDAYVAEMDTASSPARAGILNVLRRRGDTAAAPAAVAVLEDDSKDVRIAAVKAAAQLGAEDAIGPLVRFLQTDQADEREVAEKGLTRIPGDQVSAQLAAAVRPAPPAVRCALLGVLARRDAVAQLEAVFAFTRDASESVRVAAIDAVGKLADEHAAPRLLALLKKAESERERESIELALSATCRRAEPARRAVPVIAALERDNVGNYCSLLRVLGRIGGQEAFAVLEAAARDEPEQVREAAIRALGEWPEPTLADAAVLLAIADDAESLKHHVLAMRAFARMLSLRDDAPASERLPHYDAGLRIARRPDEKKMLLGQMGALADEQTLKALEIYLADEALRSEAGSAMIGVARGILPAGWAAARPALESVIEKVNDKRVQRHAEDVLKEVERHADFITDWLVAGPYMQKGKDGQAVFDVVFLPEQSGAQDVQWKPQPVTENRERYWFLDLNRSVGGDHRAAYLRTRVWSVETREVLLELGSDDGIKVWLNGAVIHANNVPRGCGPGQDKVKTTLQAGWNTLLLKVCNIGGAWGACARVRAADGGRVEGLKIDAHARAE
jgi:HEAT repeat protein